MLRFLISLAAAIAWVGAHLTYFAWYHRLLDLPFTMTTAVFSSLFALWSLALVAGLSFAWLFRIAAVAIYALAIGWSVLDFAYVQVFDTFLPFSFSRAGSMNLAMLDLLREYLFLLPRPLVMSSVALLALAVTYAFVIVPRLTRKTVAVGFFEGGRAQFRKAGGSWGLAVIGIALQAACITGAARAADGYRARVVAESGTKASREFDVKADLGVFGFAIAAKRGKTALVPARQVVSSSESALGTSKSTVEAASDALETLLADSVRSTSPVSVPVRTPDAKPLNVIIYQMESVAAWPLEQSPSPMPFLEKLMAENGSVGEYFANGCSTIDSEFAINCGYLPETHGPVSDLYAGNSYRCLPAILKERGYVTAMYHANDPRFWSRDSLAPAWGYDEMNFKEDIPFREPDATVFDRVITDMKANPKPSIRYVIGFTSHSPHASELSEYYRKVYKLDLQPYVGELGETAKRMDADEKTVREYMGFLGTADDALRHLFDRLGKEGMLENTIVVAFGDHRYYGSLAVDEMQRFRDYNRIPFFVAAPGLGAVTLAPIASHMDVAPTVYRLIAGKDAMLPASFLGHDLFSSERPNGAVTKCLGHASYYDGRQVVFGDVSFDLFKTVREDGTTAPAGVGVERLRSAALASDLALKRNDLGKASMPVVQTAAQKIRGDNLADTDGDGLSDLREIGLGLDPRKTDTDGDGFADGIEVSNGFNPAGAGRWVIGNR